MCLLIVAQDIERDANPVLVTLKWYGAVKDVRRKHKHQAFLWLDQTCFWLRAGVKIPIGSAKFDPACVVWVVDLDHGR